ncbi:MAG: hypothetical protein V1686_02355 [Patescibacteria group bacterium]
MASYDVKVGESHKIYIKRRFRVSKFLKLNSVREIMGRNLLGVDVAVRRFNVSMTNEIAKAFSVIPFTEEVLEATKNDHILIADFGISLLDVRGRVKDGLFCDQHLGFCESYGWAEEQETPQWRLIRKAEVPNSRKKNWGKQQHLLQTNEVVPMVRQMAYAIMLNCLENNERLFKRIWVRTSNVNSYGDSFSLGIFDKDGLRIIDWDDSNDDSSIGLASAKEPNL